MSTLSLKPRVMFPPIASEKARLPDGPSYTPARDSGRALIALTYVPPKGKKARVLLRNVHRSGGAMMVENVREWMRHVGRGARYSQSRNVPLERLLSHAKMIVVREPFMLTEAFPNCMIECSPAQFDAIWLNHRDTSPTSEEARGAKFVEHETPFLRLLRLHWRGHKVHEGWTPARIRRLCQAWGMSPFELAEMIQWAPGAMNHFMSGAAIRLPGPVAVWFYWLENMKLGVSIFPSMPEAEAKAS